MQELLPDLLVEDEALRFGKPLELHLPELRRYLSGAGIPPTKHGVRILETTPSKAQRDPDAKELIGFRAEVGVVGGVARGADLARPPLERDAALIPVDAHQREDEVGLVELLALRVRPDEDLGHLGLLHVCPEDERCERVAAESLEPL